MVCCVIGGGLSAMPRQWVGAVLAGRAGGHGLADVSPADVGQAVAVLRHQVPLLIVSTDGDPAPLNNCGVPVVAGGWTGSAGMLLAAFKWTAKNAWETPWVATVPAGGAPIPPDLVARLAVAVSGCAAEAACVTKGGRLVLELGLWPVRLQGDLRRVLTGGGEKSLDDWARGLSIAVVS